MPHLNDPTPISARNLSRKNVGFELIAKDAEAELRRCETDADYAAWARNWGEAFVEHRLGRMGFQ